MLYDLGLEPERKQLIMVPEYDREFFRGAISVKDFVRYFSLHILSSHGTKRSITQLRDTMLETYG
jgi:hypothetical protein